MTTPRTLRDKIESAVTVTLAVILTGALALTLVAPLLAISWRLTRWLLGW